MSTVREAAHAGSWYSDDSDTLRRQLSRFLDDASVSVQGRIRAIICPHAGYSYSGPVAGYSFKHFPRDSVKRVFVLGPSHRMYLSRCGLPKATVYNTPVGSLKIDSEVVSALRATGSFSDIDVGDDEEEHSLEMQLPFIALLTEGRDIPIVPIMVGALDKTNAQAVGKVLAPYFSDLNNFFVISSDFCHWGSRFRYQWYEASHGPIHKAIEWLDRQGMEAIASKDPARFTAYLDKYKNTICGRNPILALLQTMQASGVPCDIHFVRYAQSSACKTMTDSSVSYAAGVVSLQ